MGFPTVYDPSIPDEHQFLDIFGLRANFWAGQDVGGLVKTIWY